MPMKILKTFPPNYAELCDKFGIKGRTDVIFAYGDTIHYPSFHPLPRQLIVHEEVHGERQRAMGVEAWWRKYIDDVEFRFNEELIAHRAEWREFKLGPHATATAQRRIREAIAQRLAGPLYGNMVDIGTARLLLDNPDAALQVA